MLRWATRKRRLRQRPSRILTRLAGNQQPRASLFAYINARNMTRIVARRGGARCWRDAVRIDIRRNIDIK